MEKAESIELIRSDKFTLHNGIELTEVGEGKAIGKMTLQDYHINGVGITHGGALFTLADHTCAAAANSRDRVAVSLDGQINFIKAASKGTLTAYATEVSLRRTIAVYHVDIKNEEGDLIATFDSKFYRK